MKTAVLAGVSSLEDLKGGVCPAGHKAMYSADWGGYPDAKFLAELDPELGRLRARLPAKAYTADEVAGRLLEVETINSEEFESIFPPPFPKKSGTPAIIHVTENVI